MTLEEENYNLRLLMFYQHSHFGKSALALYGDDGEMSCNTCGCDFKRDSSEQLGNKIKMYNIKAWTELCERT